MSFLNREMARLHGIPIQNFVLDTAVLDQVLMQKKRPGPMAATIRMDSTLGSVAERYHVTNEALALLFLGCLDHSADLSADDQKDSRAGSTLLKRPSQAGIHAAESGAL